MKDFLAGKKKGYVCSVAALVLTIIGLEFFRMLTAVSAMYAEQPIIVVLAAFAAILFHLIASYKDYGKVPSIAAYAASTVAFFTLLGDRASYLAFYFSGDILGTGLSPFLVVAFVCFLAAMVLALLAVVLEGDKEHQTLPVKGDWLVVIAMVVTVGILCGIVTFHVNALVADGGHTGPDTSQNTPGQGTPGTPDDDSRPTPDQPQSKYKTPTTSEEVWQSYSGQDYAAEDVSSKTIAYQIAGHGEVDAGGPVPFDILLDLYEDGMIRMTAYGRGNAYDYYGYWTNVDDENLWFCVAYYAVHGQEKICTIDYSYDLTGMFDEVTVNIALGLADGGQFVRQMPVGGSDGTVKHPSIDRWLADLGYQAPDFSQAQPTPTPEATPAPETGDVLFSFLSDSENFLLDCNADGTYTFTFVTAGLVEHGTWEWKDWKFSLTDANGTVTNAEMDDAHALKLHFVAAVNSMVNRDFSCDSSVWGLAFGGAGNYEPA